MASPNKTGLLEAERGHRRGVVLGLTMAEIMLLLLFCLLLAAAGLLEESKDKLDAATARALAAEASLAGAGLSLPAPLVPPVASAAGLAAQLAALQLSFSEQGVELERLKALETRLQQAFPAIDRNVTDETWRELVLAEEAGSSMLETGATLQEALAAIETAQAPPAPSPGDKDWPPMIRLDSDTFRFVRNSAELSDDFRARLQSDVANQLAQLLIEFDADVVEVVGHTDEQGISATRISTLDDLAIGAMGGVVPITELVPTDNAGLGLARAISVANALGNALTVEGVKIIPLSAAQLVKPGDVISDGLHPGDDADRRRIEIRVRRSDIAVEP